MTNPQTSAADLSVTDLLHVAAHRFIKEMDKMNATTCKAEYQMISREDGRGYTVNFQVTLK